MEVCVGSLLKYKLKKKRFGLGQIIAALFKCLNTIVVIKNLIECFNYVLMQITKDCQ